MPRACFSWLSVVAALSFAVPAFAQDDDEKKAAAEEPKKDGDATAEGSQRLDERAPRAGTPLIQNKLYPMGFRLELSGFFDRSFNDKYVVHTGGHGTLGFHIFDFLAVEGFGGYLYGAETGIVGNVRNDGASAKRANEGQECNPDVGCEPQLPDMWGTTWFAGADVQWAPIYGKLSAVSELDLTFQLYGLVGAGVEGIQRKDTTGAVADSQIRVAANYGLGLRLIPWKYLAFRVELRNYNGLNPNVPEHDTADEGKCGNGYVLNSGGEKQCYPDISSSTMVQLGVSFLW
jgi:outer membrane beta-barrel protein